MKAAAAYLRVSKDRQNIDNQRPELEQLARARELDLVELYEEHGSAARARPVFQRMMADAHRGRFGVLLVWALDRFGRSMAGNVSDVLELDRRGVQVLSVREPWLDTGGPVRPLLVAIFGWVAEQERARLVERTNAGLEDARRRGVRLGRPPRRFDLTRARRMQGEGSSLRDIAQALHVPKSTVFRALGCPEKVAKKTGP